MSNIKIKTLTPVHIGNGTELQGNFEYLHFKDENKIALVDSDKVLDILGAENLHQWMSCIEKKESLLKLLQTRRPSLKAADVSSRIITVNTGTKEKPIKENIRSISGVLIPGSSLKGAFRTTVFAEQIIENAGFAKDQRNLGNFDQRGGFRFSDGPLNKIFFGNDPNHDIFRLLQVGDAVFNSTEVFKTEVVNQYRDARNNPFWKLKTELEQYVEAIPEKSETTLQIRFNESLNKLAVNNFNNNTPKLELPNLFPIVNQQTRRLVDDEINYWTGDPNNPEVLGNYIEALENIRNTIDTSNANECVLRVGWGSGFRSMTGDWHGAMSDDDFSRLIKSLRPRHPESLLYPKTTRFIAGGKPLGFIKLSF